MFLSSLLSFLPLLLVTVSATPLLFLYYSMPCFFFPPLAPFLICILQRQCWKCLFYLFCLLLQRLYCWARAVAWEPLLYAPRWFLFSLLLSFSLVFLFPEYLSNTSPLPATDSSVPLYPSTRHQWDSWFFFLVYPSISSFTLLLENWFFCLPCILTCWGRYLSLRVTVEWKNSCAGSFAPSLGIHVLLSFSLIRTVLC